MWMYEHVPAGTDMAFENGLGEELKVQDSCKAFS